MYLNLEQLVDFLNTNDNVNCVELSSSKKGKTFIVNDKPQFTTKTRLHVPFTDKCYGKSSTCRWTNFDNSSLKIPSINGYQLLTVDDGLKPKIVYLVRTASLETTIKSISTSLVTEVNVCGCMIKSSSEPHGGVIIVGTEDKLKHMMCNRLPDYMYPGSDVVDNLICVPVRDLIGAKKYLDYTLHFMLQQVLSNMPTTDYKLHMLLGVKDGVLDTAHGKRHPFETAKECALRELKEEFAVETELADKWINTHKMRFFCCT